MTRRRAIVYLRKQQFLMHASSQTTTGVWIMSEPCLAVAAERDDQELGTAIRTALDGSQTGVPHPTQWTGGFDPMLRLARVRSWKAFATGASCVGVDSDGDQLTVMPYTTKGPKDGFAPDPSGMVTLQAPSLDDLGRTVRALFAR